MSYTSERTSGINQHYLHNLPTVKFLKELGFTGLTSNAFNGNNTVSYKGFDYTLRNNVPDIETYNMYDVIALAKQCGFSDETIATAINKVNNSIKSDNKFDVFWHGAEQSTHWTPETVKAVNTNTLPGMKQLVDKLNQQYPGYKAQVVTRLDANGVTYTYELTYTDPASGKEYAYPITTDDLHLNVDGTVDDKNLNTWINSHPVGTHITANTNAQNNAQASKDLAEEAQRQLNDNSGLGVSANTGRVASQAEKDQVIAKEPGTDNLNIWNRDKDKNITGAVSNNLSNTFDPLKVSDKETRDAKLNSLQELANVSNEETVNTLLRGVNNQQAQLLEQIRNDPELYRAVTQQLRGDSASGVLAGQRAANIKNLADTQGVEYDAAAEKLYSSLFSGDNNVANAARNDLFGKKVEALDTYTQEQLNALRQAGHDAVRLSKDIGTAVDTASTALDVEASRYTNDASINAAKADAESKDLIKKILGEASTDREKNDAILKWFNDTFSRGEDAAARAGDADVSSIIDAMREVLVDGYEPGAGLTPAVTGLEAILGPNWADEIKPTKFDNTQYNAAVADTKLPQYLNDIDLLTRNYTEDDVAKAFGLDYLAEDSTKLSDMYKDYSEKANEKSNQVFNAAQRAYIAAITAGDVKTTEQLTRLAETTSGAKRNLHAAAALSDQFTKQRGLASSGKQLATDFNNQQSANIKFTADSMSKAAAAKNAYRGNGNDSYDKSTLFGGLNALNDAAVSNRASFGSYGNKLMSTTQSFEDTNTGLSVKNYEKLGDLAGTIVDANFMGLVNNIKNDSVREDVANRVNTMLKTSNSTLNKNKTNP